MRPEFRKLMTHKLTIHRRKRNTYGDFITVSSVEDVPGFVEYGKRVIADFEGEEVVASATIFLQNDAPINPEHFHWLIDQTFPYNRPGLRVLRVDPIDDPRTGKTHHYEMAVN